MQCTSDGATFDGAMGCGGGGAMRGAFHAPYGLLDFVCRRS